MEGEAVRKPIVLMVEDEDDVLALNARHLEELGCEVLSARTLAEARASLWERPPDLVLLDVRMPDGSGCDFCAEIRQVTTAPILYLTCMTEDEHIVHGLNAGGDDYIAKPYRLDVLAARVTAHLRRRGFAALGRIEMPPLVVELISGRATLDGEAISLSPKELQLLAFFMENAGQAFSEEELYAALWDAGSPPHTKTVRTHISRMRKKLRLDDDDSAFELFFTPDGRYLFQKVRFEEEG